MMITTTNNEVEMSHIGTILIVFVAFAFWNYWYCNTNVNMNPTPLTLAPVATIHRSWRWRVATVPKGSVSDSCIGHCKTIKDRFADKGIATYDKYRNFNETLILLLPFPERVLPVVERGNCICTSVFILQWIKSHGHVFVNHNCRADSGLAPNQWETSL